mmetsp:Transcript_34303/g.81279  ORF Transcript_34303/g.81279 Transcript_34303/m.81279 type:complete len:253 (-) Transcript_34303:127-885(-)
MGPDHRRAPVGDVSGPGAHRHLLHHRAAGPFGRRGAALHPQHVPLLHDAALFRADDFRARAYHQAGITRSGVVDRDAEPLLGLLHARVCDPLALEALLLHLPRSVRAEGDNAPPVLLFEIVCRGGRQLRGVLRSGYARRAHQPPLARSMGPGLQRHGRHHRASRVQEGSGLGGDEPRGARAHASNAHCLGLLAHHYGVCLRGLLELHTGAGGLRGGLPNHHVPRDHVLETHQAVRYRTASSSGVVSHRFAKR